MAQLAVLARGRVPTAATLAYTTPERPSLLKEVVWTNRTTSTLTVTLWIVAAGQAAGNDNQLYGAFSLPPNSVTRDVYSTALLPGDTIVWQASATGINGYITGLEKMPTGTFGELTTI